ncbi:NYN domain-containing protein [uncultured Enorma sp.]|uniref:NYN domain-containing protein n=1 Tax=uncultured Enorma sp. TaxID=1714346 RepID=UPI00280659DF|nr:NYN domain-containing protein [uncultured Enorma sp.]
MATDTQSDLRFAILIDADNIAPKYIKIILDEVANSGIATYKRIYGDWTSQRLTSWKNVLLDNSIIPMQQYSYTTGKSATDSAMIIDAMDILYSGTVDGFALVSSDSDFTRLAARLRESGMQVIGMGEEKTPEPFISACNQFKYLDLLFAARRNEDDVQDDDAEPEGSTKRAKRTSKSASKKAEKPSDTRKSALGRAKDGLEEEEPVGEHGAVPQRPRRAPGDMGGDIEFSELPRTARRSHMRRIRSAVDSIVDQFSDEEGWVFLGTVGSELPKRLPDFDVRNYGFRKLSPFLESLGVYEFEERANTAGARAIYLRIKEL